MHSIPKNQPEPIDTKDKVTSYELNSPRMPMDLKLYREIIKMDHNDQTAFKIVIVPIPKDKRENL